MKKPLQALIAITAVFFILLIGIFLGRNMSGSYIHLEQGISTQSTDDTQPTTNVNDGKIDINTATLQQLQMLPGIGEVLAQRIIDYRDEHGGFQSIDELLNVNGIGEVKFSNIKDKIKVITSTEAT